MIWPIQEGKLLSTFWRRLIKTTIIVPVVKKKKKCIIYNSNKCLNCLCLLTDSSQKKVKVLLESTKVVAYFRTSRGSSEYRTQHGATNYNKANFNSSLSLQTLISWYLVPKALPNKTMRAKFGTSGCWALPARSPFKFCQLTKHFN